RRQRPPDAVPDVPRRGRPADRRGAAAEAGGAQLPLADAGAAVAGEVGPGLVRRGEGAAARRAGRSDPRAVTVGPTSGFHFFLTTRPDELLASPASVAVRPPSRHGNRRVNIGSSGACVMSV